MKRPRNPRSPPGAPQGKGIQPQGRWVGLQRGKEVAGPIRVQAQARAQRSDLAPVRADLVQEAGLGEGAVTRETAVIELGHALHDGAIEPPDLFHPSLVDAEIMVRIIS